MKADDQDDFDPEDEHYKRQIERIKAQEAAKVQKPSKLDPEAQEQIDLRRASNHLFHGPICVEAFYALLPKMRWEKRALAVAVLNHIVDAYYVHGKELPHWWRNGTYVWNRTAAARRYGVSIYAISRALSQLVKLDLVSKRTMPLNDDEGKTYGRKTFVWPKMRKLMELLDSTEVKNCHSHPIGKDS